MLRAGRIGLKRALAGAFALALLLVPGAAANNGESGRWLLTGASSVSVNYWQGLTSDPSEQRLYFTGVREGLWRTTPLLRQTAGLANAIPPEVLATEGYNHIGDPTWDGREGGRVLLPLECFVFGVGNTCGTGAFGVADPETLAFRYYVKLDPSEIPKAMWAETSPGGSLIWTSSGDDLLAYRARQVSPENAGPTGPLLRAVRRLPGAVPPTGITGAVFRRGRLLLAGEKDGLYQIWAVDTRTGERRLELEMQICGEAEGIDTIPTLGGRLHWLIAPFDPGCQLSFGPTSALLHFARVRGEERLAVEVTTIDSATLPGEVDATVEVTDGGRPVRRARVSFAGAIARTDRDGVATLGADLDQPGRFGVVARKGWAFGASDLVPVGLSGLTLRARIPRTPGR